MTPMYQVEVLRAACCVAGIDKEISASEEVLLKQLAEKVGVGQASLQAMINRAKTDSNFCDEQFRVLKGDPQETIATLLNVAMADRTFPPEEQQVVATFASKLGVDADVFETLIERVTNMLKG